MQRTIKEWFQLVEDKELREKLLKEIISPTDYANSIHEAISKGISFNKRSQYWNTLLNNPIPLITDLLPENRNVERNEVIEALVNKFREEQLPNRNKSFHYDAEIDAGFDLFLKWLK